MKLVMRLLSCVVAAGLIAGCGTKIRMPQAGLTPIENVFAESNVAASVSAAPAESRKTSVFQAPYADVFRAVVVGASQNQINIESENKSQGYVLGTRAIQIVPPVPRCPNSEPYNGRALPLRYYYAIVVKERAAKRTEVTVAIKAQGTCWFGHCFESVDRPCKTYSVPHWATANENPDESMTQLMTFIRNNLIAAGAL
jgi:hypothetical protein